MPESQCCGKVRRGDGRKTHTQKSLVADLKDFVRTKNVNVENPFIIFPSVPLRKWSNCCARLDDGTESVERRGGRGRLMTIGNSVENNENQFHYNALDEASGHK